MAVKKKTPAKKKPAQKKKLSPKAAPKSRGKSSGKSSGKSPGKGKSAGKPSGKAPAKKTASAKAGAKNSKRPGRTTKRPSASRKVAAKVAANKGAKATKSKDKLPEAPEALALARSIAKVATEKKAEGVMIIDVRQRSAAVGYDYLVLATGESDRQLSAINEGVEELLKPAGKKPAAVEASADWVCVTYDVGVMAHFFTPDRRELMDLEDLWKDAPRVSA